MSLATTKGTAKEKGQKKFYISGRGCSTVVEHFPRHLNIEGLSLATTNGTASIKGKRNLIIQAVVVVQL